MGFIEHFRCMNCDRSACVCGPKKEATVTKVWRQNELASALERQKAAAPTLSIQHARMKADAWVVARAAWVLDGIGLPGETARIVEDRVRQVIREALGFGLPLSHLVPAQAVQRKYPPAQYFGFRDRLNVVEEFRQGTETLVSTTPRTVRWTPAEGFPTDDEIILADYSQGSYEGTAFVLYERDGVLYEVNAYHCSCNGLEGDWRPEETTWAALKVRDFYSMDPEPKAALAKLIAEHA